MGTRLGVFILFAQFQQLCAGNFTGLADSRFKTFAALPRNKTLDFVAREAASRWATRRRDLPPAA